MSGCRVIVMKFNDLDTYEKVRKKYHVTDEMYCSESNCRVVWIPTEKNTLKVEDMTNAKESI